MHKQLQINKSKQDCNMKILTNNQRQLIFKQLMFLVPNFDNQTSFKQSKLLHQGFDNQSKSRKTQINEII